ncbi:MAG: hypothetical protein R3C58_14635 [Parvularculaceae bacterium]
MPIEPFILAAAAAFALAVSYCGSLFAARTRKLLDEPNGRSSHRHATPRSGGLAIFGGWCAGLFVLSAFSGDARLAGAAGLYALTGLFALVVGYTDDRFNLPARWKFFGQVAAAALFTGVFGPLQSLPIPFFGEVALPFVWGAVVTILWIVAFINAFNFMDGANGLAAGTAAAGLGWICVVVSFSGAPFLAGLGPLLALAACGFLPQNLKRGRLFMGDSGSHGLGLLIAGFGVLGANWTGERMSFLVTPVVFMPLIFDVGWTLVSRFLRGQRLAEAHREHLYQLLMRGGMTHAEVAVLYIGLVCLCAAASIMMLTLPPAQHWLVPAALIALFSPFAVSITKKALARGDLAIRKKPDAAEVVGDLAGLTD